MAKLIFNYSAMNSGKTMDLIRTAYNYTENDLKIIVMKSIKDTKGNDTIVTRAGLSKKVDILVKEGDNIYTLLKDKISEMKCDSINDIKCIFIDEAQFLSEKQVIDLFIFCNTYDIPVICYGLRTNFKGELFEGSKTLLALAEELNEFKTLCSCGEIARFNARKENGEYVVEGEDVVIDGTANVEYIPLCAKCFKNNVLIKRIIKK